jgi:hypothetical protein
MDGWQLGILGCLGVLVLVVPVEPSGVQVFGLAYHSWIGIVRSISRCSCRLHMLGDLDFVYVDDLWWMACYVGWGS